MKLKKDRTKKSLPNRSDGIKEMSNLRMKLMARPLCPVIDNPDSDKYTGEPNCQQSTGNAPGWWRMCEEKDHDPYHSITRVIKKEPVLAEDGSGLITGYRERVVEQKRLNLVRIPLSTRFHSGQGERISRVLKGRKSLTELGYNEKCEFRNCEQDAEIKSKYGLFCNPRHARLVGADVETVFLNVSPNKRDTEQDFKAIDIEFEGAYVMQAPPAID